MISQANNAYQYPTRSRTVLGVAKPDKFYGKSACSCLQSLDSYFAAYRVELSDEDKLRFATSYMSGERLQG